MQKSDWKKCKLIEETTSIGDGIHGTPKYDANNDVFFINGNNLLNGHIYIKEDTKRVASVQSAIHRGVLCDRTILISINGTLGNVAYYRGEPVVLGKSACYVNISSQHEKRFFYYLFTSPMFQHYLHYEATGTTIKNVSLKSMRNFEFLLPPVEEQKRIAQILGALDDKIELLQKQNKTLEDMAKALFKSWFVDFDVVHAKANLEKRKRSPTETLGDDTLLTKADIIREYHLTDELYDLFPSSFEDSALGPIPLGWEMKPLSKIATLTMGQSPAGTTYNESGEGLPFYQGRTDFQFRFPKKRVYCSAPTRIAEKGDVLISVRAPVGDLNMANERCCIGRGVASIRSNTPNNSFLYYAMLNIQKKFDVFNTEGTVFGSINRKDLSSLAILTPSEDVLQEFNAIVISFDLKIEENLKQIQTLTELRDTLLPPLISGKIRV